jgi:toxin ParE1/3/4
MRRFKFHAKAQRDFVDIGPRSEREWGKARTRRYLDEVERKIAMIVENPMLGHDAELPREGLRRIAAGRDVIFYTFCDDRVEIVRILHDSMDFAARLG